MLGPLGRTTAAVTLAPSATDNVGVTQMQFSNDNITWSALEPYSSAAKNWTLATGNGTKTVYARYRDAAGNVGTASDTIGLDGTVPGGSVVINSGAVGTKTTSVSLAPSATDNAGGSGVSQMRFSNDNVNWTGWESYSAAAKSWSVAAGDGLKTVYVQYRDVAGNQGATANGTIYLDTLAPATTAAISAPAVGSGSVTLNVTEAGKWRSGNELHPDKERCRRSAADLQQRNPACGSKQRLHRLLGRVLVGGQRDECRDSAQVHIADHDLRSRRDGYDDADDQHAMG